MILVWMCGQLNLPTICFFYLLFLHFTQNDDDFGFFPINSCKFCTYMKAHFDYNVVDAIGLITNAR